MTQKLIQYLLAAIILIVFLSILVGAWHNGQARSQSALILQSADELEQGLSFFYSDQNRYPTAIEFASPQIMGIYLIPYPPAEFVTKFCSRSFVYQNASPKFYRLSVCLPKARGNALTGWNQFY